MTPDSMDAVFQALAHAQRRRMLDIVTERPGCSVNELCAYFDMSRIAVMKHLRVLHDAMLLVSAKEGRTRRIFFNAVPIQMIHDRWTTQYSRFWAGRLMDVKVRVESRQARAARRGRHGGAPRRR